MLSTIPVLSSNANSLNKIYLDFDGHTVTDSYWTVENDDTPGNNGQPIHAPVYNIPGDTDYEFDSNLGQYVPLPFSPEELKYIEMAWQHLAEDFAPFDVDVTTVEPPTEYFEGGGVDGGRAMRVLFTSLYDDSRLGGTGTNWAGDLSGVGTVPTVPVQDLAWNATVDRPVWVFANNFDGTGWIHPDTGGSWGPIQEYAGSIGSHEVGHGFGLMHDSVNISVAYNANGYLGEATYYGGHGNGETSWGPIMGGAELRSLTQWSKGEYAGALHHSGPNTQDDLAILSSYLGYRQDDHGDALSVGSATFLPAINGLFSASGIIGGSTGTSNGNDVDVFRFDAGSSLIDITLDIDPVAVGPNLDLEFKVYEAANLTTPLATINPADLIDGSFSFLGQGEYYVAIDGVGIGSVSTEGYSDYGSLGQYTVRGSLGAPRVVDIIIRGSNSIHDAYSFSEAFAQGTHEFQTVPVGGADTIEVAFSEWVDVQKTDLWLFGGHTGTIYTADPNDYTFLGFDDDTFRATWVFDVFEADKLVIGLNMDTGRDIRDIAGNLLDGEWAYPMGLSDPSPTSFPSGDGTEDGTFFFTFVILPGDHDLDNDGDGAGFLWWQRNYAPNATDKTFEEGDFDGDGDVDGDDLVLWQESYGLDFSSWFS